MLFCYIILVKRYLVSMGGGDVIIMAAALPSGVWRDLTRIKSVYGSDMEYGYFGRELTDGQIIIGHSGVLTTGTSGQASLVKRSGPG